MDDAYFRSRIDDIDQVIGRIHARCTAATSARRALSGEILITDNVAPAEIAQLQAQGVVAIVTSAGSVLSHSAILARSLHMPLVVGAAQVLQKINDGDVLMVDGGNGELIVEPDAADLRSYRARVRELARERKQLYRLRREPARTLDGIDIKLYSNAESRDDVAEAHALGSAGIGLYRTEFLFLQRNELPDEEEQFRAYRDVVLGMTGRAGDYPHAGSGRRQGRPHRPGDGRRAQSRARRARRASVAVVSRTVRQRSCAPSSAPAVMARCACWCRW